MASETIQIIVSTKGAVTVKRDIEGVGKSARGAASGVDTLRKALGGLTAYLGVSQLVKYADTFTNIQNRLKLVTSGTEELTAATDKLYQISQNTYQSFEGTATIYARTAKATKELGLSNKVAMRFTEQLSKSVALSGVSAESANAALIQLSQGLAAGRLNGEELNSVLEQLPYAAQTLAAGLKVPIGALKEMGKNGELTPKMIIDAFNRMTKSIDKDFANLTPTISMGLQTIENGLIRLLGLLESNTGAFGLIAQVLTLVGNNMEYVALALAPLALGLTVLAARAVIVAGVSGLMALVNTMRLVIPAINTARIAVLAFNASLLANPVTLIVVAIAAAATGILLFGKRVLELMGLWDDFKKAAIDAINSVLEYLNKFLSWVTGDEWSLKIVDDGAAEAITKAGKSVSGHWLDTFKNGGVYANDKIKEGFNYGGGKLRSTIDETTTAGALKFKTGIEAGTLSFTDAVYRTLWEMGDWLYNLFSGLFGGSDNSQVNAIKKAGTDASNQIRAAGNSAGNTASNAITKSTDDNILKVSQFGNNLVTVIEGAGETAGQKIASSASSAGASASSSISSAASTGGTTITGSIERATEKAVNAFNRAAERAELRFRSFQRDAYGNPAAHAWKDEIGNTSYITEDGILVSRFAKGGQFKVGGSGGTDSQMVRFRASPDERVTVETPTQQRRNDEMRAAGAQAGSANNNAPTINSYTVIDPNAMIDMMNTRAGHNTLINFVEINRDELRAKLGVV